LVWSEDREDWVEVKELYIGEHLRSSDGSTPVVESLTACSEPEPVYNIEVEGDHCYLVGQQGLLVHNTSAPAVGVPALDRVVAEVVEGVLQENGCCATYQAIPLKGKWSATKLPSGHNAIVYIVRDVKNNVILKPGETIDLAGRFDVYERAGKILSREIVVDIWSYEVSCSPNKKPSGIETLVRNRLIEKGYKLPWENSGRRLGHRGPGIPGERIPPEYESEGDRWDGETYVERGDPSLVPVKKEPITKDRLIALLTKYNGHTSDVAAELGLSLRRTQELIKANGLNAADYR